MAGGCSMELSPAKESSAATKAKTPKRRPASALYAELAALLPNITARASREEILDAAVAQVKVLKDTAAVLEAYRAVQSPRGDEEAIEVMSRPSVCFTVRLPAAARPGALKRVLEAFDRHGVEVLASTLARHGEVAKVTVTAAAAAPEVVERIKAEIVSIE